VSVALPAPPNARPAGHVAHAFEHRFTLDASPAEAWAWLERPETFTESQTWPFRVEFLSPEPGVPPGFHVGGISIHHGPLMSFAGVLTEIREGEYRDLHYFFGSHLFGLRRIRPTRLEFWVEPDAGGGAEVRVRIGSFVHRALARPWTWAQGIFWRRFERWMRRSLPAPAARARHASSAGGHASSPAPPRSASRAYDRSS